MEASVMDMEMIAHFMHTGLEWIGFGTLVGLIASSVLPSRASIGALATVIIGILGTVVGAALLAFFVEGVHVTPISILGFLVALGGTGVLLLSYRIVAAGSRFRGWLPFRRNHQHATTIVEV
jgi:uncharacterized membrane protein YeaQ/YmgE (transglycosylase-associated protein family)